MAIRSTQFSLISSQGFLSDAIPLNNFTLANENPALWRRLETRKRKDHMEIREILVLSSHDTCHEGGRKVL